LIAAEINKAQQDGSAQRTVSDFISEFRGLSGTGKRRDICEAVDASRVPLDAFFERGDSVIDDLLDEMKAASSPVKPRDLGIIGEENVLAMIGGKPSSRRYKRAEVDVDGIPYLIECGFSYRPSGDGRTMVCGLNWSACIGGNPFQDLGDERNLESILTEQRAGPDEPIAFFLHVASPCLTFLDQGKSNVALPDEVSEAIVTAIKQVTAVWTKQRKAEERHASARLRRDDAMSDDKPMSIREAAFAVMADAYAAASDNGALPANARQVFYAARPEVLRLTGKDTLDSGYFTQGLLIDYMAEHPDECADWDVVFSDRGHFTEPHTGHEVGLGTLAVREYVEGYAKPALIEGGFAGPRIETCGPEGRFGGLLYVEKEGFDPLLDQAQIAERFDLAIMSCKGMSVTAARELVDQTCARFKVPLFILHDFDISGFSIARTLHQTNRRFQFETVSGEDFVVHDLGLRLDDVQRLDLADERVELKRSAREQLERNGATEDEIEFLLSGQRVELNAMTSRQFIDFLEAKLIEHGVGKVVPSTEALVDAYRLFARGARTRVVVEQAITAMAEEPIATPADLAERVRAWLAEHPEEAWDAAVKAIQAQDDL